MFILPPPPKYYNYGSTLQGLQSALEATNSLTQLTETHDLSCAEGRYKALDCVFLATPLPHPSDPPALVVNPLAPTTNLPSTHSSGVRLSYVNPPRNGAGRSGSVSSGSSSMFGTPQGSDGLSGSVNSSRSQQSSASKSFGWTTSLFNGSKSSEPDELVSENGSDAGGGLRRDSLSSTISSSLGSTLSTTLSLTSSTAGKKGKPKNHLAKNNSSFVSRAILHENINKRLADRQLDDVFIWGNVGRSLSWLCTSLKQPTLVNGKNNHLNSALKHEPLTKVLFTKSHPLSHDVNAYTQSSQSLDVVVGTSSGDILWIEPISNRYNRINKNGDVTRSAVTEIRWIPGSENLFLAGTADGLLLMFDKERDDGAFTTSGGFKEQDQRSSDTFKIIRSYRTGARQNPVAVYKVSNRPLTGLTFSPSGDIVAITSNDGYLRLLNLNHEMLINIFPSYYAGFLCCEFSPDGLYLATGGQDDLVSIWSMKAKTLVARLQGHSSWVRRVKWDPYCQNQYRLGSVGEDGNFLLWDFSPRTLTRPKVLGTRDGGRAPHHSRSISELSAHSNDDRSLAPTASGASGASLSSLSTTNGTDQARPKSKDELVAPFYPQNDIPVVPPVLKKNIHVSGGEADSLSDLLFLERAIIVSGKDGRVWTWLRPGQ